MLGQGHCARRIKVGQYERAYLNMKGFYKSEYQ